MFHSKHIGCSLEDPRIHQGVSSSGSAIINFETWRFNLFSGLGVGNAIADQEKFRKYTYFPVGFQFRIISVKKFDFFWKSSIRIDQTNKEMVPGMSMIGTKYKLNERFSWITKGRIPMLSFVDTDIAPLFYREIGMEMELAAKLGRVRKRKINYSNCPKF